MKNTVKLLCAIIIMLIVFLVAFVAGNMSAACNAEISLRSNNEVSLVILGNEFIHTIE